MCDAIFQILKDEDSLELIMASYELLTDIDKAWSPFIIGSDSENEDANQNSGGTLESSGFHLLIQDLAKVAIETNIEEIETKIIAAQAIFQGSAGLGAQLHPPLLP
ncbi:Ribonucleoside-diphosphate reductase large subunit like [Actinidia chinensis var. chinensis]|uniref:Ribonucleoside-diphosphate reductase large subunit like n=1 Tax=Actinidia chinensis var. chinensis TaxID=1590841 RepID=A0A2R6QA84_ACTCC|nr:Ribonucleoside-diphosphate reductase large subunit like [Actinidia chinensis var. chinensis]